MAEGREKAVFAAAVALLVVLAGAAYLALLGRAPVTPGPGSRPAVQGERLVVAQVAGQVAIRRGGLEGAPEPALPGAALRAEDVVETGPDGVVSLEAAGSFRVELESGSLFAVKEITAELARFRLASGLASASVRDDPVRSVEIEAGAARARTRGGDLRLSASGQVAALAVTRGEAELAAGGKVVVVRAGQQTFSVGGGAPSAPAPIPSSLLLKVVWPAERATNQRRLTVTGRTAPGAVLALQGRMVKVDPDGSFRHVVYLREGRQRLTATGRDVAGHEVTERSQEILLDTRGAPAEFETEGLWEDRR